MIVTALLYIFYWAISVLVSPILLLADVTIETDANSALNTLLHYLSTINQFFPLTTLFVIIGVIITIELIIFGFKLVNWILRKIPGVS